MHSKRQDFINLPSPACWKYSANSTLFQSMIKSATLLFLCVVLGAASSLLAQAQQDSQFTLKDENNVKESDTPAHQTINPKWKLVWSDEFDEPNIDPSKWNFEIDGKGGGNGEKEYYTDDSKNAYIEEGCLAIKAIQNGYYHGEKHDYTSARMTTKGKGDWLYGRFEARIKMPTGKGVWPAFWMMPTDEKYGGWARSGELDIVEEVGDKPGTAFGTIHYGGSWPNNVHTGDKWNVPSGASLSDDFHVYAVEWEPGTIRWYIDGQLYQTQKKWNTDAAPFPAPFDQKFFIILNFAVGGAWPGDPAPSTAFPQTMTVDYVRVYQSDEYANGVPQTMPSTSTSSTH